MKKSIFTLFLILFLTTVANGRQELHVSPAGDDANPGTEAQPMRTLQHALDAFTEDEQVLCVHTGRYEITEPIRVQLKSEKQRLTITTWPTNACAEPATISAGRIIAGWREIEPGLAVAEIPEVKAGAWDFRDLYVNDRRAVRARHPNTGFFRVDKAGEDRRTNFTYNDGDLKNWPDLENVELVFMHDWSITRCPIKEIDESERRLTVPDKIGCDIDFFMIDNWEPHPRYFVENSREFLDAPGEWFLDKKEGKLYYRLAEGETLQTLEAVAPVAKQIMAVTGFADACYGVYPDYTWQVEFENLRFQHAAGFFPKPKNTYWGMQAAVYFPHLDANEPLHAAPAAIQCENIAHFQFMNCEFSHLGENGLWLGKNVSYGAIFMCKFHDIGANGLMIGTHGHDGYARNCFIYMSDFSKTCQTLYGGSAIWVGFAAGTRIDSNQIRDTAYSGISLGWQWNPQPSPSRENRIEGNHIHDCMQLLSDAGCIYTLGWQPDSMIESNLLHGVPMAHGRAESNGMFLDEGTKGFTIERNFIYDTGQSSLRFHRADTNIVKKNVLANHADVPMIRYNSTPEENITLIDNETPDPDTDEFRARAKEQLKFLKVVFRLRE